jgi:6-phosphogluconate dehydrogenase
MQLGMIGLGRMGANMVRRLLRTGHDCIVFDSSAANVQALVKEGARGSKSLDEFVAMLEQPRAIWIMVPAGAVDTVLGDLAPKLDADDILIDGGNSYYIDDIRRAKQFESQRLQYVDVGTSGGVWGLERGYCLMIGGPAKAVTRLDPIFRSLAPGQGATPPTPGRPEGAGTADQGYLHCGPVGAGHFVKMVHNGIEYGLMAAYAEGFNILRHANAGTQQRSLDAETTPLRHPEHYQYDFNLPDIAEVWRRGSVVASWLLDLTAAALVDEADLRMFAGHVSDSGEGRWTIQAAIESSAPAPVLSAALYQRFMSRGEADFANRLLSAMRYQFGGHREHHAQAELARSQS